MQNESQRIQICNFLQTPNEVTRETEALARLTQREHDLRLQFLRGQSGDAVAYSALLKALSAHLRAFFRRKLVRLPDDVEDLVQETLIAIHNQRHTYDENQPFTAWAFAIGRYKLIDRYRQYTRHDAKNASLDEDMELFASQDDEASDAKRDVAKLLDTLPDKQKLPIQMVKIEGLSVAEAAAKTGLSESAVKVGIHRGLKILAARIRGDVK
jgi:RNA polymerase sigma-70 factor, ECF subfamily